MSIENKENNIKKGETIEEAEIIEESEESESSRLTCKQCGYFGGGHLENCPSLEGKEKLELKCPLCEAFDGHAVYCENNPENKQEKERERIKEEKEFSFSEPKKTSGETLPLEKSPQKKSSVELPERIKMEFNKLEKLILNTFSNEKINKKIAHRILDDYFAEMKFYYDNDKNLKDFNFEEDKYSLVSAINNKYANSDFMDILPESGHGFSKNNIIDYDKKEKEGESEFIAELAENAAFAIFEMIMADKDCEIIKLEGKYKGTIDSNIKEKIEQYTDEIISKKFLGKLKNGNQFENFFEELLKKEGGALGKYYSHVLKINIDDVERKSDINFMKELDKRHKNDAKSMLNAFIKYKKMEDKKINTRFIEDATKIIEKKLWEIQKRESVIYNSI